MPGSNTPVLQLEQYSEIVALKSSGGSAILDEEHENIKLKTKQWRWKNDYTLENGTNGSVLKYKKKEVGKVVSHTGRMFSDLVEVYCPQKKHVHSTDGKKEKGQVKATYGRSITGECITFFLMSCPICLFEKDENGMLLLHRQAAYSKGLSLESLNILFDAHPEAIRVQDNLGLLPLHHACLNEVTSLDALMSLVKLYPESILQCN